MKMCGHYGTYIVLLLTRLNRQIGEMLLFVLTDIWVFPILNLKLDLLD